MKRINIPFIIILLSSVWLVFFIYNFINYQTVNTELMELQVIINDVENKNYYEKSLQSLQIEYDSLGQSGYVKKSSSEFIATLPKIAEMTGIQKLNINNKGVRVEQELVFIEAHAFTGPVGTISPVTIELARGETLNENMPDIPGFIHPGIERNFSHRGSVFGCGKQLQGDCGSMTAEDCKLHSPVTKGCA